jgi:hypothetical protein
MTPILLATLTSLVVGKVEVAPNLCRVDYLIDQSVVVSVYQPCDQPVSPNPPKFGC